jgi:hypothetical protein
MQQLHRFLHPNGNLKGEGVHIYAPCCGGAARPPKDKPKKKAAAPPPKEKKASPSPPLKLGKPKQDDRSPPGKPFGGQTKAGVADQALRTESLSLGSRHGSGHTPHEDSDLFETKLHAVSVVGDTAPLQLLDEPIEWAHPQDRARRRERLAKFLKKFSGEGSGHTLDTGQE